MLARGVLCRLAADVPKTSTHDLPQLRRFVQRAILSRNATSISSNRALSHTCKLALPSSRRSYVTATKEAPKTRVKKTTTTTTTKKAAPKNTVTNLKTTVAKKKTAPKKKKKPKAKAAPRKKRALTEKGKERKAKEDLRDSIKEYKKKALVEPKPRPTTAWMIFSAENLCSATPGSPRNTTEVLKAAAEKYKSFTPAEMEHYNHLVNENKAANEAEYKAWVLKHTPEEIRVANSARVQLRRILGKPSKTAGSTRHRFPPHTTKIVDERQVKQAVSPYILFSIERHSSGDMKNIPMTEASNLILSEWKNLSASEKKKYEDESVANLAKYHKDYETTYGHKSTTMQKAAA
ncbi:hypothetical protein K432DRAFT_399340 [Lepidopterella palustris CBS 459.81]|uniref:HMG box domain-containing protein n=1 Tax=Lepidopterella palustris CBS 459.81 TaxID=1314670 RepID=A0A8E2EM20_9PEZI|nr:hypothetical protein K432DRAFT_399340 [Lepidopterella palustris CBS 459.81]